MKYSVPALFLAAFANCASAAFAWDGFDSESIELVEIQMDSDPGIGETLDIKYQESGITRTGIVQSVKHNKSTIEIAIRYPDNSLRTLVMEGR